MRNEFFKKVLLGATEDTTLVFANIRVGGGNRDYFSVSFDEVSPFLATNEFLRERAENNIDGADGEFLYDLCERFDCKPSDLVDELVGEAIYFGIEELVDISLYPESYYIEGYDESVYFESESCGQHDTRDILIPIDPEFSEWLHSMWNKYHLQTLSGDYKEMTTEKVMNYLDSLNEEEWIQNWLEENKDNL